MEKQTDFRIRSYGRTELAQLYNPCLTPKAAYRKLVGWIDHYPGLAVRLAELGKLPGSRSYTPAQVREIVEALGESNQRIKAEPASLLRSLRSLSRLKLASLRQQTLRTLTAVSALDAHQLRPEVEPDGSLGMADAACFSRRQKRGGGGLGGCRYR